MLYAEEQTTAMGKRVLKSGDHVLPNIRLHVGHPRLCMMMFYVKQLVESGWVKPKIVLNGAHWERPTLQWII